MVVERVPGLKEIAVESMRRECLTHFLRFVQLMFKAKHGKDFIIRKHHIEIAKALLKILTGETKRLIINVAPRYGKTELAVKMFIAIGLAYNAAAKFIHVSYSDKLVLDNSDKTRQYVSSEAYQKLFPHVVVNRNESKQQWSTSEGGGVYATSTNGQITGFGAGEAKELSAAEKALQAEADQQLYDFISSLDSKPVHKEQTYQKVWKDAPAYILQIFKNFFGAIIIDDPIKPEDAESEVKRDNVNNGFDSTIRTRVNSADTPIVIIMQRLHPNDLAGYLEAEEPGVWTIVKIKAWNEETDEVLDETKHTATDFKKMQKRDNVTLQRQFQQNPSPREGLLYKEFDTYKQISAAATRVRCFIDPADTGEDYLAAVFYRLFKNQAYVVDIIYTQERAETTEVLIAAKLTKYKAELCKIEGNGAGRSQGRLIKAQVKELSNQFTRFEYYAQTKNKEARILNNASEVNNFFVFPEGWEDEHREAYKSMTFYTATGKNKHDDLQDDLTSIAEHEIGIRSDVVIKKRA